MSQTFQQTKITDSATATLAVQYCCQWVFLALHIFKPKLRSQLFAGIVGLPDEVTQEMLLEDDAFLQLFHHALLEVTLEEGALICPETGRRFPVSKGIPNLLLHEDEC